MESFLSTHLFELRPIVSADINDVYKGLSDPEVIRYYGVNFTSLEETKSQMRWYTDLEDQKTGPWWSIRSIAEKKFTGAIGFNYFHSTHRCAELGFWLLPEFWGKGVLKEIIPIVFGFAVEKWNLHRMEATVESENTSCIRLLENTGFVFEGCRHECEYKNGKFIDLNIYAKLAK